jgi:hypothetical protein
VITFAIESRSRDSLYSSPCSSRNSRMFCGSNEDHEDQQHRSPSTCNGTHGISEMLLARSILWRAYSIKARDQHVILTLHSPEVAVCGGHQWLNTTCFQDLHQGVENGLGNDMLLGRSSCSATLGVSITDGWFSTHQVVSNSASGHTQPGLPVLAEVLDSG